LLCPTGRKKGDMIMIKASRLILALCACSVVGVLPASACRYNVRETGFVDLGIEPYVLCFYVDANTPAELAGKLRRISDEVLAGSNILPRLVDIDKQKGHPAIKHLDSAGLSVPAGVLISPDGQSLPVPLSQPGQSLEQTLRGALDKILFSPKRKELLKAVAKAYGVVLVVEGPDPARNAEAKKAASAAIEHVKSQMDYMPKPVKYPPELVVLDAKSLAGEQVLLWSLGLEAKDVNEPHAIVLYGRARWIGPLFKGDQITMEDLASVLFIVGADCECGFDYRWLQGTMLPAKWTRKLHELAVDSLGFDPESPMIKMEIGSIVGRGMRGYYYAGAPYGYRELIFEPESASDYQEFEVQPLAEPNESSPQVDSPLERDDSLKLHEPNTTQMQLEKVPGPNTAAIAKQNPAEPNVARAEPATRPAADIYMPVRSAALLTIGMFAVVVVVGIAVLARTKRG